jgi:tagatose-6-phosphate ketose/aldose isomerase
MSEIDGEIVSWQQDVRNRVPELSDLLGTPEEAQDAAGYGHTLREILQQPATWKDTARRVVESLADLRRLILGPSAKDRIQAVMITGSGSSLYVGECVAPSLQLALGVPVRAVAGGDLLTHPGSAGLHGRPRLLVSIARSGNSPESTAAVQYFLENDPHCRHLFITCNARGRLATTWCGDPRTVALVLDDRTNDRGLAMTSSFTNMVLAARSLGMTDDPERFCRIVERLSETARQSLLSGASTLARVANGEFRYAVYLGAAGRFGGAREASLKMMEMSAGRVRTMAETFLGLRHGPMASIHSDTLVVCFLSASSPARAYETDLIRELGQKNLGWRKVIVGEDIPRDLLRPEDVAIECPGLSEAGDQFAPVIDVLTGQLLAFFRCRALGLQPDAPSPDGIINRVVETFRVHPHQ